MMKYENAKTQIQKELSAERLLRLKAIQTHFKTQTHYCYIFSNTIQEMEEKMRSIPQYHSLIDSKPLTRSEEHTSELQSRFDLVCRLLLEKKNIKLFLAS